MASTEALRELPTESNNENDNSNQQKQKNRRHKLLLELLLDFARNTTLHGPRYITERGLSVVEKIFWMVTFIASLCLCILVMWKIWVKWETSPVIISLSEQLGSVTEIPFPAVTICPEAKINQLLYNYTKHMSDLQIFKREDLIKFPRASRKEALKNFMKNHPSIAKLYAMELVCEIDVPSFTHYDSVKLSTDIVDYTAVQSFQEVAPRLRDILNYFTWQENFFGLETKHLSPVLTKEGVCFTFNSLHVEEIFHVDRIQSKYTYMETHFRQYGWSLQDGYSSPSYDTYPIRGRVNRGRPDLNLRLNDIWYRDALCNGFEKGYKVYLHHPADLPQSSLYYYAVLPEEVASFAIKPIVMKTADTLADYPPHIRQCYYPGERDLRYFKLYTPNNCQLECVTNYTLEYCGCVWFHMPHNDEVKLCSIKWLSCLFEALEELSTDGINNSETSFCGCMPLCNSVQYEADVLKTRYYAHDYNVVSSDFQKLVINHSQANDTEKIQVTSQDLHPSNTKIEMYFKEPRFRAMLRSELFGLTEFLSECGGVLGLFLGFSFLSLVEIFYFFTLRLGCRSRRNNKAEEKEIDNNFKNV